MLTKVVASRPGTVPVFTQEGVGGKKTLRASICKNRLSCGNATSD